MTKMGVFVRLSILALMLVGAASVQGSYRAHSQTANVDDALASFNFEEEADMPTVWYDDEYEYYDTPVYDDEYEYYDTPVYYYDETGGYYYEPMRPHAPSYTTYISPSSPNTYLYTTVVPLGGAVGMQAIPTAPTPSAPTRVQPVSFDVVPLGVPVGGVQQTTQITPQHVYQTQSNYASFGAPTFVAPLSPTPTAPPPSCNLYATPAVAGGGNIVFRWNTANAVTATLSNVGIVPLQSTYYPISAPIGAYTYTLTVQDAFGRMAQCTASVQAIMPQYIGYQKPWCAITAQPSNVRAGENVTLSWASTNTTSASLADAGAVGTVGTYAVAANTSRAYTLTVHGPGGSDSCDTYVTVEARGAPVSAPKAPTCSLSADPSAVFPGASTTLRWSATRATNASLSGVGAVGLSGLTTVSPTTTTTYILTAKGDGGVKTCAVDVAVQPAASCTVTCGGVTYACAPSATPVGVQCPATAAKQSGFWSWLTDLFH